MKMNMRKRGMSISGIASRRLGRALLGAFAVLAMIAGTRDAKAIGVFVDNDAFNSSPLDWSPWQVGTHSLILNGHDSDAHSPSNDALIAFGTGGSTSDFALLDKQFDVSPSVPSVLPIEKCFAALYVRPNGGAKGALQMIDANSFTYIGSQSFNLAASTTWTQVTVSNTATCTHSIVLRIVVNSTTRPQLLYIDDAQILWYVRGFG